MASSANSCPVQWIFPQRRTAAHPRRGVELAATSTTTTGCARTGRRLSRRAVPRHGRWRLARHLHPARVRRFGPGPGRGGDADAFGERKRRRHVGCVGAAHEHLRPEPGRRVRQRRTEAPHAAPHRAGAREGLLRRHRAEHRAEHHAAEDTRAAAGRHTSSMARRCGSPPRRWPTRCCCWPAPRHSNSVEAAQGLSLFYTALDRRHVQVREIDKMGRKCVDSNELFIEGLKIPLEDRIGEEGRGFDCILHGMNPERVLIAAEAVGLGHLALSRAAPMRRSVSSSTGRSARTRASSIRWRPTGWRWKPPG